jgi:DNA-binding SARP family transcriptional activator
VVDDAHELVGTPQETGLEHLLASASDRVSVAVGSRRALPAIAARGELAARGVVDDVALRLRSWEVERLFREHFRMPLDPDDVAALTWHTAGWPVALHLFHRSVRNDLPGEQRQAIRRLDHRYRYAWDYLATQVLAPLPLDVQRFLHRTAVFEELTEARCDRLDGVDGSRELLLSLARSTSLARRADDGAVRVHRVLRGHLLAAVSDELSVSRYRSWHAEAAAVLESEGAADEALAARCRAHDLPGVTRLLTAAGLGARGPRARAWSSLIPPELLEGDPRAQLLRARELVLDGRIGEAEAWAARAEPRRAEAPDEYAVLRATLDAWGGAGGPARSGASRPELDTAGAGLGGHACAQVVRTALAGNPAAALADVRGLEGGARSLAEGVAQLLAGDQRRAGPSLRAAAGQVDAGAGAMLFAELAAAVLVDRLAPDELHVRLDRIHSEAERRELPWLSRVTHGVVLAFDDDPLTRREASRSVEYCRRVGDPWGAVCLSGAVALARARYGDDSPADWEAFVAESRRLGMGSFEAWARAGYALSAARAELPDALEAAEVAEAVARVAQVPGALAVAYLALAAAKPAERQELRVLAASTAASAGMVGLAVEAASAERAPVGEPAEAVEAVETTRPARVTTSEPPVLRVRCFGAFSVSVDGRPVDLGRLRPRARRTLRLLATRAGHAVHRQQLATALWGDLDLAAAMHNLHVNVSAVRRILEPGATRGSERVIRRDGETYMLPLLPGSECDVVQLEQRLRRARRLAGERVADAMDGWQAVLDVYAGELLPEEGNAEWVLPLRERYAQEAAGAASSLATLALRSGQPERAADAARRSIEIDRWGDAPWRVLVDSLVALGDRAAAGRARDEYHAVLRELGVGPDVTSVRAPRPLPSPRRSRASPGTSRRS